MATVQIREINEAVAGQMTRGVASMGAGDSTDKTGGTVRFKQASNATVDANNPIPIPAAGTNRSHEKILSVALITLDGDANIDNLTFYTSAAASPWTGVSLFAGAAGPVSFEPNYAGDADGDFAAAYQPPGNTADSTRATVDAFSYTAGVPLDLETNGGGNGDTGPFLAANEGQHVGNLLYMQMDVGPTASAGTLAGTTMTFAFDEN